jgi:hypothetical protein
LLVTTVLAALAVGAVLVIDAHMQDDLQEPMASMEPAAPREAPPDEDGARLDPESACWGPFLPQICLPPLVPSDPEAEGTPLDEPIAKEPALPQKPRAGELPEVALEAPEEVALADRVFASVIDSWHAPRACAAAVGAVAGTPTVRVEMDIDGEGRVKDARALDVDGVAERELASCLEARARGLRFPPEEIRRETTRDATFVF